MTKRLETRNYIAKFLISVLDGKENGIQVI